MSVTLLFGSSYIERLRQYCSDDLQVPGTVIFCGKPGLRTDRIDKQFLKRAIEAKATCVFLHVGGNDITCSSSPKEIFSRICELNDEFINSGVRKVWVAEILPRGNFVKSPGLTQEAFDSQRQKINKLLFKKYGGQLVKFKDISFPKDYLPDLVHLEPRETTTKNTGMKKYISRIRRIICSV